MPGPKISNEAILKIVELKSQSNISNRQISEILKINRNTINHYIKLYEEGEISTSQKGQVNALKQKSYKDTLRYREFASFIRNYIDKKDTELSLLAIWKEYKSRSQDGYGYTQFCKTFKKLNELVVAQQISGIDNYPVLFCNRLKGQELDMTTGELNDTIDIYLLFPLSGVYFKQSLSEVAIDPMINFLKQVYLRLNCMPTKIQVLPYSTVNIKLPIEPTKELHDWLSMIDIKLVNISNDSKAAATRLLATCIKMNAGSRPIEFCQGMKNVFDVRFETNLGEEHDVVVDKGLTRSEIFIAIDLSNINSLPKSFPEPRKIIDVRVQKMSHFYLPEDRHYYSVPSKYISHQLTVKYDLDMVNVYTSNELIWRHNRDLRSHKYTSVKEHFSDENEWTRKYFLSRASRIGPSAMAYVAKLIDQYTSPEMGFKQANAILRLQKSYSKIVIEQICCKLQSDRLITYQNLKRNLSEL